MAKATVAPGKSLLLPADHADTMSAHQSQMAFATKSLGATELRNNADLISHAANAFTSQPSSPASPRSASQALCSMRSKTPAPPTVPARASLRRTGRSHPLGGPACRSDRLINGADQRRNDRKLG
jgi:hypothetical protein